MEKIQAILNQVESLPPSPSLLPKLPPYLGDVNANFDEVVKHIALDPTLTARLLQICNSAFFGQDEPIATVMNEHPSTSTPATWPAENSHSKNRATSSMA